MEDDIMLKSEVAAGPVYQIRIFRTGRCRVLGQYSYRNIHRGTDHPFNIYVAVIQGNGLNALVDTGMESVEEMNHNAGFLMSELIAQEPGEDSLSIVRKAGLEPGDIHYVLPTHCHYDHCSSLPLFENATAVIPAYAWSLWHAEPEKARYLHAGFFPYLETLDARGKLCKLDEGLVAPGLGVRRVGGHTPCSQFIYVNTARGVAVFTGDTVQKYRNVDENDIIGICDDEAECWRALEIVRQDADVFLPGHDPKVLDRYPDGWIA
jgi:glyoxylase-like metal-dependent hydrolase (beta-lactamase superfamily II)